MGGGGRAEMSGKRAWMRAWNQRHPPREERQPCPTDAVAERARGRGRRQRPSNAPSPRLPPATVPNAAVRERGMIEGGMARRRVMADSAPGCLLVRRGRQGKGIDGESGGGMRGCGMEQEAEVEKVGLGGKGGSGKVGE